MPHYLKRTDGRNAAGEGRTITGVSMQRGDPDNVVFIADEKRAGDTTIKKSVYDETLAANVAFNATAPVPAPDPPLPLPEPPLTDDETRALRALLG